MLDNDALQRPPTKAIHPPEASPNTTQSRHWALPRVEESSLFPRPELSSDGWDHIPGTNPHGPTDMDNRDTEARGSETLPHSSSTDNKIKFFKEKSDDSSEQGEAEAHIEYIIGNKVIKATPTFKIEDIDPTLKADVATQTEHIPSYTNLDRDNDALAKSDDDKFTPDPLTIKSVATKADSNKLQSPVDAVDDINISKTVNSSSLLNDLKGEKTEAEILEQARFNEELFNISSPTGSIEEEVTSFSGNIAPTNESTPKLDGLKSNGVEFTTNVSDIGETANTIPEALEVTTESADFDIVLQRPPTNASMQEDLNLPSKDSDEKEITVNVTEEKEKDAIETYSQFAERVALEIKKDCKLFTSVIIVVNLVIIFNCREYQLMI